MNRRRAGENPQETFTKLLISRRAAIIDSEDRTIEPIERDKLKSDIKNANRHIDYTFNHLKHLQN